MRLRPLVGVVLFLTSVGVAAFMSFVELTSTVDTEPIYFLPLLLGAAVGLVLCIKAPDNNTGVLISVATLGLAGLGSGDVVWTWALDRDFELLAVVASLVNDTSWLVLFVSVLVLLPIWFPNGRANSWWSKWAARAAVGASLVAAASFWLAEEVCVRWLGEVCVQYAENPLGINGNDGLWAEPLLFVPIAMIIPAIVAAVVRRRRSVGVERQQLKWFGLAVTLMVVGFALSFDVFGLPKAINDLLSSLALSGVWVSIGLAVLKYRLYDIDRIISRTFSYAIVVALLVGAVALLATVVGTQFDSPLLVAATTLGVAAVFNPLRRRIQTIVDRRFNRSKYDAERVMDGFAASLRDQPDSSQVVDGWAAVVSETMRPSSMGVWVRE